MQSEKHTKIRRKYDRTGEPANFKTEVLKMLASGQTPAYIANPLGISENIIYRWKNVNQGGKKSNQLTGDLTIENPGGEPQQLRDRVQQLETEREILQKALSIFSRAT